MRAPDIDILILRLPTGLSQNNPRRASDNADRGRCGEPSRKFVECPHEAVAIVDCHLALR